MTKIWGIGNASERYDSDSDKSNTRRGRSNKSIKQVVVADMACLQIGTMEIRKINIARAGAYRICTMQQSSGVMQQQKILDCCRSKMRTVS